MRIESSQSGKEVSPSDRPAASSPAASSSSCPVGGPGVSEDQAQHAGTHLLVGALAGEVALLPAVRQEKVSALRQAVQSGDYRPDPEQVAGALFSHLGTNGPGVLGEENRSANQEWAAAI
jgi:flagellar biosynthesis anti-sigma factor FlgM